MPNKPYKTKSKVKMCADFLEDLGCTDVNYFVDTDYIPAHVIVFFIPSKSFEEVIQQVK